MAQGKREETRELLMQQAWTISLLFRERPVHETEVRAFIRTGQPAAADERPKLSPEMRAAVEARQKLKRETGSYWEQN
jgi:hypothetical protein